MMQLHLCDGNKTHEEICYDGEQCSKGCPLCIANDVIGLLIKENEQLRMGRKKLEKSREVDETEVQK